LLWYLSDPAWPEPNLALLNNALAQTHWADGEVTPANWRLHVWQKLQAVNWAGIASDVQPFVEQSFDVGLLRLESFEGLLKG
jgi:hypothetical protein